MSVEVEIYALVQVLTVGIYMLIADFASDIMEKLHQFNRILTSLTDEEITEDDIALLKQKLKEIIDFYAEARELSAKIYFLFIKTLIYNFFKGSLIDSRIYTWPLCLHAQYS